MAVVKFLAVRRNPVFLSRMDSWQKKLTTIFKRKAYLRTLLEGYNESTRAAILRGESFPRSCAADWPVSLRREPLAPDSKPADQPDFSAYAVAREVFQADHPNTPRVTWLNSRRDPWREAARAAEGFRSQPGLVLILSGLGSAHKLPGLLAARRPPNLVIVLERNANLPAVVLEPYLLDFLEEPGCHLFASGMEDLLEQYLDSMPVRHLAGVRVFRDAASFRLDREWYQEMEGRVFQVLSNRMSDLLTRLEFEKRWIHNILSNSWSFFRRREPENQVGSPEAAGPPRVSLSRDLPGRGTVVPRDNSPTGSDPKSPGCPAVLVSAGPSLCDSLPWLKANQDSLWILAVDTALPVLVQAGVRPDAAITLDSQSHSQSHFLSPIPPDIPLLADMVASPPLLRQQSRQGRHLCFYTTAQYRVNLAGEMEREHTPGMDFPQGRGVEPGDVQSGGSVATSAFDLLRTMGFSDIILLGQDLAYTGLQLHSQGSHHYRKWHRRQHRLFNPETINIQIIRKRHTRPVTGINKKWVLSDFILDVYASWFERSAGSVTARLWNGTARGLILSEDNFRPLDTRRPGPLPPEIIPDPDKARRSKEKARAWFASKTPGLRNHNPEKLTNYAEGRTLPSIPREDFYRVLIACLTKESAGRQNFAFLKLLDRKKELLERRKQLRRQENDPALVPEEKQAAKDSGDRREVRELAGRLLRLPEDSF